MCIASHCHFGNTILKENKVKDRERERESE